VRGLSGRKRLIGSDGRVNDARLGKVAAKVQMLENKPPSESPISTPQKVQQSKRMRHGDDGVGNNENYGSATSASEDYREQ
jgi:hypothetical protein